MEQARVKLEVGSGAALRKLPYWRQGDREMLEIERAVGRFYLRTEPAVAQVLHEWWLVVQRSLEAAGATRLDGLSYAIYREVTPPQETRTRCGTSTRRHRHRRPPCRWSHLLPT